MKKGDLIENGQVLFQYYKGSHDALKKVTVTSVTPTQAKTNSIYTDKIYREIIDVGMFLPKKERLAVKVIGGGYMFLPTPELEKDLKEFEQKIAVKNYFNEHSVNQMRVELIEKFYNIIKEE